MCSKSLLHCKLHQYSSTCLASALVVPPSLMVCCAPAPLPIAQADLHVCMECLSEHLFRDHLQTCLRSHIAAWLMTSFAIFVSAVLVVDDMGL